MELILSGGVFRVPSPIAFEGNTTTSEWWLSRIRWTTLDLPGQCLERRPVQDDCDPNCDAYFRRSYYVSEIYRYVRND